MASRGGDSLIEKETGSLGEPCKINSDEDNGKESDIDMIIDEIAREKTDNEKGNSFSGSVTKPKRRMRVGTVRRRTPRGRFIRQRGGRGFMHRVVKMRLPKIPDGILYVKNGTYIGYHCTYCNCALKTLLTMKQHVAGARHRETLKSKKIKERSTAEKNVEKLSTAPANEDEPESDLKSSLDEYLATVTEPVVGLSHITEMVSEGNPSNFECDLCKFSGFASNIKEHINGTRHRLMYLKAVDPERIAEMMSKNLTKTERNEKIIDHAKELEAKNGRGTIQVKNKESEVSDEEEEEPNIASSGRPVQIRRSIRRAREWVHGRRRGGRLASIRRGMRGIRGGRRSLIRGGRRGGLNRGRILRRSLSRMNSERRKQSIARRFRGRISHNALFDPYATSYYSDYNDWVMRTGSNQYEDDAYYGRDPYYPEPCSSVSKEYYVDHPYERMDRPPPQEVYPRYDYSRSPYEDEPPSREYGPSSFRNRDQHSTSPNQSRSSQHKPESADVEENPLKNLPKFNVTNEKDAGVVMNVITSLAESLLGYKLRGSPQEILKKLEEEKKTSASSYHEKSDSRAAENFPKLSDALDQPLRNWDESGEIRARHSGTYEQSTHGWAGHRSQDHIQRKHDIHDRTPPPSRRQMDITQDISPPRRSMDIGRIRPLSPPRRPVDMHDRSPPLQRRTMDIRARSPSSVSRSAIEISHNRRSPPRGPMGVMRTHSPPPSRRSIDVMRNRSPPLSRGSASFVRDRSPPPPSFVDDMFDDYQKSQNAMRGNYSTPTGSAPPGYRSSLSGSSNYGTPASYASPPPSFNTPNFNRSSETRRLSNTGSFGDNQERNVLDWKYRSLR